MSVSLLFIGFLTGMRHATEADHVAAMATFVNRNQSLRASARHGALWGLGHTMTLFIFAGVAVAMGKAIPEHYASALEGAVGVMLILLGADVLRRLARHNVHFHTHSHGDELKHFHAHCHESHASHSRDPHRHTHADKPGMRALLVGLMHGLAGSAALTVLVAHDAGSLAEGLSYILFFGLGSVLGMGILSTIIMMPILRLRDRGMNRFYRGAQWALAGLSISVGGTIIYNSSLAF